MIFIKNLIYQLNLPLKRTLFDKISKKAVVKRENREKLALETLNSRLRDFEIQLNSETENYNSYRLKKTKENIDHNNDLTRRKDLLLRKDKEEIESLLEAFINTLIYIPANNEKANIPDFEVQFQAGKDVLIVSRKLPSKVVLPKFSDIKWNKRNNDIEMVKWKDKEFHQFHEDVIFQISLLTIKHIFEFSPQEVIKRVVFNGWIDYVNSSTGRDESACIISLDVERDNFMNINLDKVDYKNCIKGLKGIISPDFINMLPVQPKLDLDRTDRRFINSKDVSEKLENGFNLAVMEWEEFEYLIRQLFSKIFTYENSEVKITQASRDGGVDAIAFDPDPIRGGKFIIQAKRYNILVPVSAVRDLYGTILHEGATRGILVTTSEYGRDAYMFAKDKPITLINGQELLSLLHQHGFNDVTIVLKKNQTL